MLRCALSYEDNIQEKGENHPYLKAVRKLGQLLIKRSLNPLLYPDFIYSRTKDGKVNKELCDYVHDFAMRIITSRKQKLAEKEDDDKANTKRHLDFLDILLTARDEEGHGLTDREIRDEVDTFMFADIPKGVMTDIPLYQLHNNPHVWKEPEKFCPERFEKSVFADRDPYVYVPFSAGPRNCIGQNFAMNEIKTMVARIVHSCQFAQ
nr:hypothetical protein BaRGS_015392 [Batillaria attramentaria]